MAVLACAIVLAFVDSCIVWWISFTQNPLGQRGGFWGGPIREDLTLEEVPPPPSRGHFLPLPPPCFAVPPAPFLPP